MGKHIKNGSLNTSKEIFEKHWIKTTGKELDEVTIHHMMYALDAMIEFAKLHVQEALKEASKKAEINYEDFSGKYIDKDSILNAYNLDDIK